MQRLTSFIVSSLILTLMLSACDDSPAQTETPLYVENYSGPIPEGAQRRIGRGMYEALALTTDGSQLVMGSHLGVYLYETDSMAEQWFYPTLTKLRSIALSPDDRLIAAGELGYRVITILDLQTGDAVAQLDGHTLGICDLEFSPDGSLLASTSYDNTLILWDTATWQPVHVIEGDQTGGNGLSFSPDGKQIAFTVDSGTIYIVDTESGEVLKDFTTSEYVAYGAEWSPQGDLLATGADNTALLWDIDEGRVIDTIDGFDEKVERLDFSPDGSTLLAASHGDTGVLWDIKQEEVIAHYDAHALDFSADGSRYVVGSYDNRLTVYDTSTHEPLVNLVGHTDDILKMAWLPDGSLITSTHIVGVQQWQLDEPDVQTLFDAPLWSFDMSASDDGQYIAVGGRDSMAVHQRDGSRLWRIEAEGRIEEIVFSPSGERVAIGFNNQIAVSEVTSGAIISRLDESAYTMVFLNEEQLLIGGRGTLLLWDSADEETRYRNIIHQGLLLQLVLVDEGNIAASLGLDNVIYLTDVASGDVIRSYDTGLRSAIVMAASPDGKYLATGSASGEIVLLDAEDGRIEGRYKGHATQITDLLFSPNSTTLVSSAIDGTLVFWDMP